MKINWKRLLINLGIPLAVGGVSALISGGMGQYKIMNQPPLSPPGWIFPVVWTILYLLMGYAAYRVQVSGKSQEESRKATQLYAAQLALNFLWTPVVFGLQWYLVAFFLLVALWVMIYLTMQAFSKIDETAGDLLIPYILWVTFAWYLNLGIFLLN
jgi:tryptophan-rich sensory protein